MFRKSSLPRFLLLLAALSLPAAAAPEKDQVKWLELRSPHFVVITDAGDKRGREITLRFEQMRAVFGSLLLKDRLSMPEPLTIIALKSDQQFFQSAPLRQGKPIAAPGFFIHGDDQNFIVLNALEPEPWRAVAHDFAHMFLYYNYPAVPGWFDEGLAEYFASIRVDDRQLEIGGDPELFSPDSAEPSKPLTELLDTQPWSSLADLSAARPAAPYHESSRRSLYYAQSWMLMHYLLNQKKLPETGAYFDLVQNQHVPMEDALQKAYGMTSAQLDQAVKDYFHSLAPLAAALEDSKKPGAVPTSSRQPYQLLVPVGPDDKLITVKPIPEADAQALVAEVRIRVPERRDQGMKELQALAGPASAPASAAPAKDASEDEDAKTPATKASAATSAGNEPAHRVLAWEHIERAEFDGAAEELGAAATLNQNDMWVRYYLSLLKYRIALSKHADIQGLANMMQDLRAVLDWYPEFADAYDLMAVARMEGGGQVSAMQAARAAMQLSPRNELYTLHLAEIYIAQKKWEAAQALLQLLQASSNPAIAAAAAEQISKVKTEQKYGVSGSTASATQPLPDGKPQKSPFDILEQDAAQRAQGQKADAPDSRPILFLKGELLNVDCSAPPVALLRVSSGGKTHRLRAHDYPSLLLIGAEKFSCDWHDRPVSVNYKSGGAADGEVVSLEIR
jgi:hypothetical protein